LMRTDICSKAMREKGRRRDTVELNRRTVKILACMIAFAILLNVVVHNVTNVKMWFTKALGVMTPIIIGFALAFLINIPVTLIEKHLLKKRKGKISALLHRFRRPISICLSYITVIAVIAGVMGIMLPQFTAALTGAIGKIQPLVEQVRAYMTEYEDEAPELVRWINSFNIDWEAVRLQLNGYLKSGIVPAVNFVTTAATSVFGMATNVFLGIILSINILSIKEKLVRQVKSVLRAYLKPERAERIIEVGRMAHSVFTSFFTCQVTEALILAGLCYIGMLIFRFPYAFLISVIVGVTALVPIFGAWVATGIGAVLILTVKPVMAIWFVVFFVILQQIEGNMIYPRVVGTKVGLPAMWVLISITIGGGTLGVAGMLLSVPTCAVIYTVLRKSVNERIAQRELEGAEGIPAAETQAIVAAIPAPAQQGKERKSPVASRGNSKKRR